MDHLSLKGRHFLPLLFLVLGACSVDKRGALPRAKVAQGSRSSEPEFVQLAGGQRVSVRHYGDPNGFPVFFFHGWPSDSSQGALMDAAAKARGFHVLAPDRPGFGRSDPQPGRKLTDWPPIVSAIADHYHIRRFAVSGVSGGGPYALVTAWALPKRVTSATVVSCAVPLAEGADGTELAPLYRVLLGAYREHPKTVRQFFRVTKPVMVMMPSPVLWLMTRALPPPDRAALAEPGAFAIVCASFRKGWNSCRDGVFEDAALNAQPWGFAPEKIRVPVTFWHGTEDHNFRPSTVRRLAARVPGSRLHIVENEGHFSLPLRQITSIVAGVGR